MPSSPMKCTRSGLNRCRGRCRAISFSASCACRRAPSALPDALLAPKTALAGLLVAATNSCSEDLQGVSKQNQPYFTWLRKLSQHVQSCYSCCHATGCTALCSCRRPASSCKRFTQPKGGHQLPVLLSSLARICCLPSTPCTPYGAVKLLSSITRSNTPVCSSRRGAKQSHPAAATCAPSAGTPGFMEPSQIWRLN